MEHHQILWLFVWKKKNSFNFKKLFTYGSGTYMKDFMSSKKSRKNSGLKCIFK